MRQANFTEGAKCPQYSRGHKLSVRKYHLKLDILASREAGGQNLATDLYIDAFLQQVS